MVDDAAEDGLAARQDGRVYPVGRALRTTFHAENHDSLGSDLTGLMIDLSRVPDGAEEIVQAARLTPPARPAATPAGTQSAGAPGWWRKLGDLIARR